MLDIDETIVKEARRYFGTAMVEEEHCSFLTIYKNVIAAVDAARGSETPIGVVSRYAPDTMFSAPFDIVVWTGGAHSADWNPAIPTPPRRNPAKAGCPEYAGCEERCS